MLQVNGKRFDKFDKSNPFTEIYLSGMKLFHDFGFKTLILESPLHKISKTNEGNNEYSAGGWSNFRQKYVHEKGEFDVIYYETSFLNNRKNNAEEFRPRKYNYNGAMDTIVVAQNPDLAFFLVFVSANCELKVEFDQLQNKIRRDKRDILWKIQDKKAEARNTVAMMQDSLKIQNAIYSEEHSLPIETIKVIARNVGIHSIDSLSEEQIRVRVGEYFLEQTNGVYNKKKLEEFKEINPGATKKIDEFAVCKAVVSELKELKMIEVKKAGGKFEYRTMAGDAIVTFPPGRNADETLAFFFKENPGEREMFENKIKELKNQT